MTEEAEKYLETVVSLKAGTEAGELPVGSIVATKYKIISHLGKGGMGSVYRVHQIFLQQDQALKVLSRSGSADDVHIRRFQNEGKAAFNLNHPNLVKVHDFGLLEDQSPYLVMDYISGTTLADFLKSESSLTIEQVVKIISQACLGLAYAHQNSVVHRDVKPSNIMLVDNVLLGEEGSVKIVDFGIAKVLNAENEMQTLTQTGEVFGSPFYMSPEQCSGAAIDHRTDVYSLGCVLFEALTGTPPYVGTTALRTMMLHQSGNAPSLKQASLGKEFPAELEAIVHKMLEKDPALRYQNLGIVANELADLTRQELVTVPVTPAQRSAPKSLNKRTIVVSLIGCLAAACFLIANSQKSVNTSILETHKKTAPTADKKSEKETGSIRTNTNFLANKVPEEIIRKYSAAIKNASPFIPVAVQTGGTLQYKILFPECGIGRITHKPLNYKSRGEIRNVSCMAKGLKYFSSPGPYGFEADVRTEPWTFETPSVLKKFGSETLNELALLYTNEFHDNATAPLGELQEIGIEKMLKIATSWKHLKSLQLKNIPLTQQAVVEINHMPALKHITLSDLKSMEIISQQPFIQNLTHVSLKEVEANDLLRAISKSKKLEMISLEHTDFLAESLMTLKDCPALTHIAVVEQNQLNDLRFAALISLKQVRKIDFGSSAVSAKQVAALERCKWLKEISFSPASKSEVAAMTKDPRFTFFDQ